MARLSGSAAGSIVSAGSRPEPDVSGGWVAVVIRTQARTQSLTLGGTSRMVHGGPWHGRRDAKCTGQSVLCASRFPVTSSTR